MKIYAIDGIGDIHMTHKDYEMRETVNQPAITFFTITGAKNVASDAHTGQVVKISSDERYAVLESASPPSPTIFLTGQQASSNHTHKKRPPLFSGETVIIIPITTLFPTLCP